ncbi:hypothetical protein [Chitinimonas sp. BJB300]|uniref:hypothetical protein n=1 Tax=Chitinimonas sp. BJB300 TaxID=1559339 RepID=UPI001E43808C|nr:hypothetical protein [Chitinimonas sp. BJB300]
MRPVDAPGFIAAQLAGAIAAALVFGWLLRDRAPLSLDLMANAGEGRTVRPLRD